MNEIEALAFRPGSVAPKKLAAAQISALCGVSVNDAYKLDYIDGVTTVDSLYSHRMVFLDRFDDRVCGILGETQCESILVIGPPQYEDAISQPRVITELPRSCFAKIVRELFSYLDPSLAQKERIHPSARIDPSAVVSAGVVVGAHSVIEEAVYLYPNVSIASNVRIGRGSLIKSGSVVGQPGFGIYRDVDGNPRHLPHVGGVILGEEVEIGALNTIASGTIHPTALGDSVKTDDHVHIAHNVRIDSGALLTACVELSGSVQVGANSWIGPNSSVLDGISIGRDAFVAIGSNVVKSVGDGERVGGNPARRLPKV